ncbi:MAG: rhomboid family intramembrane serine protease [Chitinophagaceae bacterium]|nr:rhomboid family intramembrane serine protease [Chitinophagaceae bacterium]
MNYQDYPITIALIAANVIFSLIGFSNAALVDKTIMWPYRVARENQYIRFITSGFLHGDYMHLIFNMFTLFFLAATWNCISVITDWAAISPTWHFIF